MSLLLVQLMAIIYSDIFTVVSVIIVGIMYMLFLLIPETSLSTDDMIYPVKIYNTLNNQSNYA